ncbi:unnamed protein product, partial [Ilex paraguariensis]
MKPQRALLYHFRGGVKGGYIQPKQRVMIESQRHSYHLVDPSPWPISVFTRSFGNHRRRCDVHAPIQGGATLLSLGLIFLLYTMFVWWRDVLRESTLEGHHTKVVQLGPRYGFLLFIVSEVMFFFAFFRASSHSSLAPTVEIGGIWPPKGIGVLDPWEIPFLNTLYSPFIRSCRNLGSSCYTRGEGKTSSLRFSSYRFTGSSTLFSIICGIRQYLGHLTKEHHVGFESSCM